MRMYNPYAYRPCMLVLGNMHEYSHERKWEVIKCIIINNEAIPKTRIKDQEYK